MVGELKTLGVETMTELLTAAQMRAIEQAAIASGEVTGLELMERAGRGVVEAIFEEWPDLRGNGHRAVVLCGPGNNGGDGFVVARLLKEAGWDVEVFLYGDAGKLPPDARVNYERWGELGGTSPISEFNAWKCHYELAVDALFGTGLTRAVDCDVAKIVNDACAIDRVVSVDMPSGCCSDSGRTLLHGANEAYLPQIRPSLTVTFQFAKSGHYLGEGADICEKIAISDIGLDRNSALMELGVRPNKNSKKRRVDLTIAPRLIPRWWYEPDCNWSWLGKFSKDQPHKYSNGHSLIISGSVGKGGAARLAARGALRVGAGAVTVGCPPAALIENAAQLNAIMLRSVKGVDGLDDVLSDDRMNALCMGPGMGVSDESRGLIEAGLKSGRAMVLDADALTLIGRDAPLFALLHDTCVLTPHAGEFARLFPDIAEKLVAPATKGPAYSKVDATREAAKRASCVVLFKGPDTVIADPSGRCSINASVYERSAPWLATAGSGDVLAGFITGLLARGFAPMQAAETGAWLHTECALSFGPGLIAEDLPEELPKVFRALGI
ncbi:YjeF family protein [Roseobacter sp. CCS2]|nr:YjeF family protein [Roseobacter sp. CCS2]